MIIRYLLIVIVILSAVLAGGSMFAQEAPLDYQLELEIILPEDQDKGNWFQPRPAAIPAATNDETPTVVMTIQQAIGSDFFTGLSVMKTLDLGQTWTPPEALPQLGWRPAEDDLTVGICDVTLGWHGPTGKVLGIGHTARYTKRGFAGFGHRRDTVYTVHDPKSGTWTPWAVFEFPRTDDDKYYFNGVHGQWLVEPDGTILVPAYYVPPNKGFLLRGMVMRCKFDGSKLSYLEHGQELIHPVKRGLYEKSLTFHDGRYFITMRNDQKGFVATSDDGLNFGPIKPWTFEDGSDLGSYNTQQKWVTHSDGLFLVYTRRGADNDHIVRHRAPLFIARVDTERLCVIRESERIAVPERGRALGNFDATTINDRETWITVGGGPAYMARIIWNKPNRLAGHAVEPEQPLPWRVGIGKADIMSPLEVGILMSSGRRLWQPFDGVRMPLEARALVVDRDGLQLAVVSLDLLGLSDEAVGGMTQFKKRVAANAGGTIKADHIVLCSTHTHSAPASLGCTDLIHTKPFKAWVDDLSRQIGSAVKDAATSTRPCRLMVGAESAPGHTVNRRIKTKQGIRSYRATMDPDIVIGPEGPTDELVNVAAFMDGSNRPLALVVSAPCHPVHEMCIPQVSPDFPGEMVRELDRRHAGCMAMFLNGAAGNMNPPLVSGGADDAREHGLLLAETVDRALGKLRRVEGNALGISWRKIELPSRDPQGRPLEESLKARVAAIRLGNAACCFLPGEPFIETSLAIREASGWDFTMVVGYAEDWIGYIPTDRAFDNGGYEARPGAWSKLRRGSEPIFRRQAIDLVSGLGEAR